MTIRKTTHLILALATAAPFLPGAAFAQPFPRAAEATASRFAQIDAARVGPPAAPPSVASPAMPAAGATRATILSLPSAVPTTGEAVPATAQPEDTARAPVRQVAFTLRQLGAQGPLSLRGTSELQGVQFGIRADEVVTGATLTLGGAMSPALLPNLSNVTVTLNEQYVGTIPANRDKPNFDNTEMVLNPLFFQTDNRLNFRFTGSYTAECNDPLSGLLWSTISDTSTLTLTLVRLPAQRDLARLPLPFLDMHERRAFSLPFVMSANPGNDALLAAGILSSWFGQQADFRRASFPVSTAPVPTGNAVVLATPAALPAGIAVPAIDGPTVAIVANPNDPSGSFLLVAGRDDAELLAAAKSLALGSRALSGETARVAPATIAERKPYDAPAWIPTDRPVRLGELVDASDLQGVGYTPGTMRVPFRTAPDLFTWRNHGFPLNISYRAPPGPILDLAVSRLDVGINNLYLRSVPLAASASWGRTQLASLVGRVPGLSTLLSSDENRVAQTVEVPLYGVFGQNELQFFFDTRPLSRGECRGVPNDLRMSVEPDSTIDLTRAHRFTTLPNLAFFVSSGFPFTRMADLSETAIVLPRQPGPAEVQAYLDVMGRLGALTGYPVVRASVLRPDGLSGIGDRDVLLIGSLAGLQGAEGLLNNSAVHIEKGNLSVRLGSELDGVRHFFGDPSVEQRRSARAAVGTVASDSLIALVGSESPLASGRSVVALVATQREALQGAVANLWEPERAAEIKGDLSLLSGSQPTSYRIGPSYTVGQLPAWFYPAYLLENSPLRILLVLVGGSVLLAFVFFGVLRRRSASRTQHLRG